MPTAVYGRILRGSGWLRVAVGLLARVPNAALLMVLTLVVSERTGSLTLAGAAVAAAGLAGGASGPVIAGLTGRLGPVPVVLTVSLLQAGALVALADALTDRAPSGGAVLALSGIAGALNPAVGALARAAWGRRLPHEAHREHQAVLAIEAACDEASFVIGPALTALAVALAWPWPLWATAAAALLLQPAFALLMGGRDAREPAGRLPTRPEPPGEAHPGLGHRGLHRPPLTHLVLTPLVLASSAGLVFGSTQTGVVAVMRAAGSASGAGPVYAAVGAASALVGLALPFLPGGVRARLAVGSILLGAGAAVLILTGGTALLALGCALLGAGVAPSLLAAYSLVQQAVPPGRLAPVMALLGTGTSAGVALGAAAGGLLAGRAPTAPFALSLLAGAVIALLAVSAGRPTGRAGAQEPDPRKARAELPGLRNRRVPNSSALCATESAQPKRPQT